MTAAIAFVQLGAGAAEYPESAFHLAARSWEPLKVSPDDYLDVIEGLCRFAAQHQDARGAIIDPFLNREHQYSTPYFAFAVGVLAHADRAGDLLPHGVKAMDHATARVAEGNRGIPDEHGEFFIAPLTEALSLYEDHVSGEISAKWRERMTVPVTHIIEDVQMKTNNWRTYAMKGEWLRYRAGLVSRGDLVRFIEDGWRQRTQRERIVPTLWNLYQDWNGDPQSHAVEAVGRGNLLSLALHDYDGPSAGEIRRTVLRGTEVSLLLQDPTGQCPPNGRTDNHVFNDVLYQLIFDGMAEATHDSAPWRAGQYRRAAILSFDSIERWRRNDGNWAGSFYVTKNYFDPADRVGYQPASQYMNYNGAVMYHLGEAYIARKSEIAERPTPAEIGGYAFTTDYGFGSAVANAGGMQVFLNLRGDTVAKYGKFWTPLGVVRFSRAGWDSRLGPSDGAVDVETQRGVTFAPVWKRGTRWVRLAEVAEHYRGVFTPEFVHPLLVKFSVLYSPVTGVGGPSFRMDFVVTPDGVLVTVSSPHDVEFGLTIPVLENDGRELETWFEDSDIGCRYTNGEDEQHFLVLNESARVHADHEPLQSAYGWLRPVRVETEEESVRVFVYPRSNGDPSAQKVRESFRVTGKGFESVLGDVAGTLYRGRTSAGGYGNSVDVDSDGEADVDFGEAVNFVAQVADGDVSAVEADRESDAIIRGITYHVKTYEPVHLGPIVN